MSDDVELAKPSKDERLEKRWRWYLVPVRLQSGKLTEYEYRGYSAIHAQQRALAGYPSDLDPAVWAGPATLTTQKWDLFTTRDD